MTFLNKWWHYLHIHAVDAQDTWGSQEFDVILDACRALTPGRALDVGCGDGFLCHLLTGAGWAVNGITYKQEEADAAVAQDPALAGRVHVGDFHDMPYPASTFDLCISRQALEHALSPVVVLWEMHRVLHEGGVLVLHLPPHEIEDGSTPTHHYAFSGKQWMRMVELNGFVVTQTYNDDRFGGFCIEAVKAPSIPLIEALP